jgi:opacity protein-like surface antigen
MGVIRYLVVGTVFVCGYSYMGSLADAQDVQGKWGLGINAGPSFMTQDVNSEEPSDVGKVGPIVNGEIVYIMQDGALGLSVEWERHKVKESNVDSGDGTTISILPFTELRIPATENIIPYVSLGLGININSFDQSSAVNNTCTLLGASSCKIELNNSFALRINAGIEYLVTQNLALNTGIAWKLNSTHANITGNVAGIGFNDEIKAHLNTFSLLLGFHYYF